MQETIALYWSEHGKVITIGLVILGLIIWGIYQDDDGSSSGSGSD